MKIFCISCKSDTNHEIIKEYNQAYTPEENPKMQIDFAEGTWQILKCNGCGEVSFRESWINSEDCNPITGDLTESVKFYPQRGEDILFIKPFYNIPPGLKRIYSETIDCYNNESYTLCAVGLRIIIDGVCADKGIEDGPIPVIQKDGSTIIERKSDLRGKIEGLNEQGFLTKKHSKILHEHRFLGNEAVHDLDRPSKEELKLAIDIIEHTLENIYELESKAELLRQKKKIRKK